MRLLDRGDLCGKSLSYVCSPPASVRKETGKSRAKFGSRTAPGKGPAIFKSPKGIQAIKAQEQVCSLGLTALGPLIEKAGKAPGLCHKTYRLHRHGPYNRKLSEKRARAVVECRRPRKDLGRLSPKPEKDD